MVRCLSLKGDQFKYIVFYKPFNVLTQFSPIGDKLALNQFDFPAMVYPVGRLDYDSEGLLILTDDPSLNAKLLSPENRHWRTYLAQVEGIPKTEQIQQLCQGVAININGKSYQTLPAKAKILENEPNLPQRFPPIRYRAAIPSTWIQLKLREGKNRQVRKMTAKVQCPTLRLVRYAIENLTIEGMQSGEWNEFSRAKIFEKLNII